jgi:transcriptional antiterminator RfaH
LKQEPFIHPQDLLQHPYGESEAGSGRWWVLHTRPRAEKALARKLLDRDGRFFLPMHERVWRNQGRMFRSYLPLFPGYVFLNGGDEARVAALETNLVAHTLPVQDQRELNDDLARVYRMITTGAPLTPEERLEPGDPVVIVKGAMAGLEGTVLRKGKQLKFVVEVQLLRRAVSAEVEGWMIQPRGVQSAVGA